MKYSHIIWDFNGTLLDDVDVAVETANIMLKKRSMKTLRGREEYYSVFRFPVIDYYHLLGYDFEKESYDDVAREWVEIYIEITRTAPLRIGVVSALEALSGSSEMVVLSATEKDMLALQIDRLGIRRFFSRIIGTDNIYGSGKSKVALEWKESEKPSSMLVVGDTAHDLECARLLGADCILLSGGHQSEEQLRLLGVPVLSGPGELVDYLKNR